MSRSAEIDGEEALRWRQVLRKWKDVAERMTPPGRIVYQTQSVMAAAARARKASEGDQNGGKSQG